MRVEYFILGIIAIMIISGSVGMGLEQYYEYKLKVNECIRKSDKSN